MKIGIIGGTGRMGKGFAFRWGKNHDIMIGSRDAERAISTAAEYTTQAISAYDQINGTITGKENISMFGKNFIVWHFCKFTHIQFN